MSLMQLTEPMSEAEMFFDSYLQKYIDKIIKIYKKANDYNDPEHDDYSRKLSQMHESTGNYVYNEYRKNHYYNNNLSSIFTILIQNAGRFAESFASDIIIDIEGIKRDLENIDEPITEPTVHIAAIRQSGVDGNGFYCANLENNKDSSYYRKIFMVCLIPAAMLTDAEYKKNDVHAYLIDITYDFYSHTSDMQKHLRDLR